MMVFHTFYYTQILCYDLRLNFHSITARDCLLKLDEYEKLTWGLKTPVCFPKRS